MPELPDVECFRRRFRQHAAGKRIQAVRVDERILRCAAPAEAVPLLEGKRFALPSRRGRWLLCPTDDSVVAAIRFDEIDALTWSLDDHDSPDTLARFDVAGGSIHYRANAPAGEIWIAPSQETLDEVLAGIGPDALEVDMWRFLQRLDDHTDTVAAVLRDQSVIAGLGDETVRETLARAEIDPATPLPAISPEDRCRIYQHMRDVLHTTIEHRAETLD